MRGKKRCCGWEKKRRGRRRRRKKKKKTTCKGIEAEMMRQEIKASKWEIRLVGKWKETGVSSQVRVRRQVGETTKGETALGEMRLMWKVRGVRWGRYGRWDKAGGCGYRYLLLPRLCQVVQGINHPLVYLHNADLHNHIAFTCTLLIFAPRYSHPESFWHLKREY